MCLDAEMIVGLLLLWIGAPLVLFSGIIFAAYKLVRNQATKLK